jgi:hypothetical protein
LKDFIFQVGKWWAILSFTALLFYLVYPKYDFYPRSGLIRINRITGTVERIVGGQWVNFEKPKTIKDTKKISTKKPSRAPRDLFDDIGILKENQKNDKKGKGITNICE